MTEFDQQYDKSGHKAIWSTCIDCGKLRLVRFVNASKRCRFCKPRGSNHHLWKGGLNGGYLFIRINPDDFFYSMSQHGQIAEHRLVMARHLGRCLHSWEVVHHKNGIRDDNRIENLELSQQGAHLLSHSKGYKDGYQKGITDAHDKRIKDLEARVTLLEAELAISSSVEVTNE